MAKPIRRSMRWIFILCLFSVSFATAQNSTAGNIQQHYKVYVFLSETCPMCRGYAYLLNDLHGQYAEKGIEFVGVFPNFFATDSTIAEFQKEFEVRFPLEKDHNNVLTAKLGATLTPEIFVTDQQGAVVYRGLVNDGYYRPGKRKMVVTHHYLQDALESLIQGLPIQTPVTVPLGCIIVQN